MIICIHVSIVITIPSQALITYSSLLRSFISFLLPSNLLLLLYKKPVHFPLAKMAMKWWWWWSWKDANIQFQVDSLRIHFVRKTSKWWFVIFMCHQYNILCQTNLSICQKNFFSGTVLTKMSTLLLEDYEVTKSSLMWPWHVRMVSRWRHTKSS